jgi:cobalt-zinc-cadmium efflux system membrane fusion protein
MVRERVPRKGECPNTLVRITMPADAVRSAGIETVKVASVTVRESIHATAQTEYLPGTYARVAPRVAGIVSEVHAAMGQTVQAGTILAFVDSQAIGDSVSDLRRAQAMLKLRERTHQQEVDLARKNIGTGRDLLAAETALEEARISLAATRQRLLVQGIAPADLDGLATSDTVATRAPVRAPFAGTVLEVHAVVGDTAGPGRPLFELADLSRLRLDVDVYERDLPKIQAKQVVVFRLDGLPGKRFVGHVRSVGGSVDPATRTVPVFADVKNHEGLLRARMFGHAAIRVRPAEPQIVVPESALQTDGDCWFVFTNPVANVFKTRAVELGSAYEGRFEIRGGLAAGERIVTAGSFLLKTEVLRGEMGAG